MLLKELQHNLDLKSLCFRLARNYLDIESLSTDAKLSESEIKCILDYFETTEFLEKGYEEMAKAFKAKFLSLNEVRSENKSKLTEVEFTKTKDALLSFYEGVRTYVYALTVDYTDDLFSNIFSSFNYTFVL